MKVGAGAYLLSRDSSGRIQVKFDSSIHTKKFLLEVLEELKMEYASLYIHWYSMLKRTQKEKGMLPPEQLPELKHKLDELTKEVDEEIYEKYKISEEVLANLME